MAQAVNGEDGGSEVWKLFE